ncbi:MAG: T9SS type A sorting domain-containing protein [Candidatus Cloacimonetes bacterium]|nr:T9SS type A sorting domain-containing protein [Candidatus Cloacimonadota bacterium]
MKRLILLTLLVSACLLLSATRWQTITNLSHVYDFVPLGEWDTYFATWGGVVHSWGGNGEIPAGQEILTTADGLASNDVRTLEYIALNQSLWLGTAASGITIFSPQGTQQLNTSLGLLSNNVVKIVEQGANILVATKAGLASYYYLEGINFPLLLHQYTTQTTPGLLSNSIEAMELASTNYLYLSSAEGINFVHLDSLDVDSAWHSFADFPGTTGTAKKLSVRAGNLIVAAPLTVFTHSDDPWTGGWQSYGQAEGILLEAISSAALDGLGALWVSYGTWNEDFLSYTRSSDTLLTRIDSAGSVLHWAETEAGLGAKSIAKIVTNEDMVYLCSWGDGVFSQWEGTPSGDFGWQQTLPNSIGFPKITCIATDANHAAWFGSGALSAMPVRKSTLGASRFLNGAWQTFTTVNSPIHTDNVYTVAVDSRDRKWFGTYDVNQSSPDDWRYGVSIYDEANNIWKYLDRGGIHLWNPETGDYGPPEPNSARLLGNTDLHISRDLYGNMFVACYNDGFSVLDPNDNLIAEFTIPNSANQRSIFCHHNGSQYFIGTYNDRGLVIWNHDSIPETDGPHWVRPEPPELNNCEIYGVVSAQSPYEGTQHWIAASNGLFMWDETDWYKWDTSVKRFKFNPVTRIWDNDILYYVDEERLYGSVRTTPTAIFLDPFNRVWIGSLEHGISMYDPATERFTNYYQANSPLLSNYITALGYQPVEGLLLIGTPEGLNTLKIGISEKPEATLENLVIYPNPFRPAERNSVIIRNHPTETLPRGLNQCRIYDSAGALVRILEENEFARFEWDGFNAAGKACASGIYFVVVNDDKGNRRTGKIALLR